MPNIEQTKENLLALMDILRMETDEEHHLQIPEIQELLEKRGFSPGRKRLYRDMAILMEAGWDIVHDGKGYFLASDTFEIAELKLLVDTIQCSRFITEKKSYELIEKLESLTSRHRASQLRRQLFLVGRPKTSNEQIYYNIDAIYAAINSDSEIKFDYMTRQTDGSRIKRGEYTASPYGLCWDNENYYLIAHREDRGRTHFRVDRMEHIERLNTPRKNPELYKDLNMAQYSKQVFGMFGGEPASVRMQFPTILADSAVDRFGSDIMMIPGPDDTFTLTVDVDVSPVFYAWVFSFAGRVKILGPEHVVQEYREMCLKAAES